MESSWKRQSDDSARWHAAGVPPVVVALMLRDQSAPPETAAAWYYSDLTTAQIAADRRQGLKPPHLRRIAEFREAGLPTNSGFLSTWRQLSAQEVLEAIDRGFPDAATFAEWSGTDADFSEVAPFLEGSTRRRLLSGRRWLELVRAGLSPGEIDLVAEVGIEPEDARKWSDTSIQTDRLRAWIESGFKPRSAKAWARVTTDPSIAQALIESGFTAREAERMVPEEGWTLSTVRAAFAERAGATPDESVAWARTGITQTEFEGWIEAGFTPTQADRWHNAAFDASSAAEWRSASFPPDAARKWRSAGVDAKQAQRRRAAGIRPPSAT